MDTTGPDDPRPPPVTADDETMSAIVQERYGSAPEDVLRFAKIERPTIGDGEVLVRVHAAGLDRGTWHIMAGLPYPIRLMGFGVRAPKNRVRGREVSGRVEAVGKAVTGLQVGDEVSASRRVPSPSTPAPDRTSSPSSRPASASSGPPPSPFPHSPPCKRSATAGTYSPDTRC